jgi:hypothetical protein
MTCVAPEVEKERANRILGRALCKVDTMHSHEAGKYMFSHVHIVCSRGGLEELSKLIAASVVSNHRRTMKRVQ